MMTPEDKEAQLRVLVLPIPGKPLGRETSVVEDPTGVYAVGATGSVLWPAAISLIEKLDKVMPQDSKDLRVVELGAGLGPVGIFLQRHRGCHVALTDVPESLPLLHRNVSENFANGREPEVLPLRWGDAPQLQVLTACGHYDLVVGSDITYRPEHIGELLHSASVLLRPGGSVHFSLQDRPGEHDALWAAAEGSRLRIVSCAEAPIPQSGAENGSALEEGAARWGGHGAPDLVTSTSIWLFELELRSDVDVHGSCASGDPFLPAPSDMNEVEAEFFRITGIQPDIGLRPEPKPSPVEPAETAASLATLKDSPLLDVLMFAPSSRTVAVASAGRNGTELGAKSKELKGKLIQEYLDRGLGHLLCDVDEDVRGALEAIKKEDRPRSDQQKKRFADDFYGRRAVNDGASEASVATTADTLCPEVAADKVVCAEVTEARSTARSCVPGLEWDVTVSKEDKQLSATVMFKEEVWEALQGSSGSSNKSFREAVSFELSEQELRVTYMGSSVLELCLAEPVNAEAATGKLSSKQRRVTVLAPLA